MAKKEAPGREVPEFFQRFIECIPRAALTPRGLRLSNQGETMTIRNRLQMDETIVPSHRCTKCGALWRFWTPQEQPTTEGGWSLVGNDCGTCCDNAEMGEQIEPLTMGDLRLWL